MNPRAADHDAPIAAPPPIHPWREGHKLNVPLTSRSGLQPNRLEALAVLALDDGPCRLGVIGEGERLAVPVQRLAGILGRLDREKPGLGAADALLERAPVVRRVDAQAFIDPGVPVVHALVLG